MSFGTAPRENFKPMSALDHGSGLQKMSLRAKGGHIAGPVYKNDKGYNGHLITTEEMKGCNTSQFLVHKDSSWVKEIDDLDYELDSPRYLPGLCDIMPA